MIRWLLYAAGALVVAWMLGAGFVLAKMVVGGQADNGSTKKED